MRVRRRASTSRATGRSRRKSPPPSSHSGCNPEVVLLGWVGDLAPWYARAKILFLPSRWEACGLVLIEAAARGCPSVATRVEGVPEFIQDGRNGLLFEQGDVEAASRQLARLAHDAALHQSLADQARLDARGRDAATMVASYRDLYRRLGLALP